MKKNNKGFMLIEVIVTSTIVVTTMIALYTSFNKLYNNYRTKNSYYNQNGLYAIKETINAMTKAYISNVNINGFINKNFYSNNYGYIIKNGSRCAMNLEICSNLINLYKINNMILVEYDKTILYDIKNQVENQTFKDYIDYIISYYDIGTTAENFNYIMLAELIDENDSEQYTYANLRMR